MNALRIAAFAGSLAALLAPAVPATAEDLSAEDILQRLKAQRTRTLGFVDASKPAGEQAQEQTSVSVAPSAPEAPTAPTGLALAPVDGGTDSGVTLSATAAPAAGSNTAPTVQTQTGSGAAPATGTTVITGLQPVDGGSSTVVTTATDAGIAKPGAAQVAATATGSDSMPTLATASAEALTIDLTIYFDFDSAVIQAASKPQIEALCQAIKLDTGVGTYRIIGHTDAKGKASYNKRLSQARADEVVRYMVSKCGIDATRLNAVGLGEEQLKLPQEPGSGENRRVEVQVLS